ncbi:MAG: DUF167 domain-containing protein [Planctomycetaceae bacterium]
MIALRAATTGVVIPVYAQPGARQAKCVGEHDGCLKLAVTAPPEGGAANAALVELLAETLGVKRGQVRLTSGGSQRRKQFTLDGLSLEEVASKIATLLG